MAPIHQRSTKKIVPHITDKRADGNRIIDYKLVYSTKSRGTKRKAAEPVVEKPKAKPLLTRPLSAVEYELLAHIFFSKPGDIEIEKQRN